MAWEKEDSREPESHPRLLLWPLHASLCVLDAVGFSIAAVFVDIFPQWKGAGASHYIASAEKRIFLNLMEWCLAEQGRFLNTWRWCCLFPRILYSRERERERVRGLWGRRERDTIFLTKRFSKIYLFILGCAGLRCSAGFSVVVASGGFSLAVVPGLLIMLTSFVLEHRLECLGFSS